VRRPVAFLELADPGIDALLELGIWAPAIRPPTVPRGSSRLRVTFSAAHEPHDVEQLLEALAVLRAGCLLR